MHKIKMLKYVLAEPKIWEKSKRLRNRNYFKFKGHNRYKVKKYFI